MSCVWTTRGVKTLVSTQHTLWEHTKGSHLSTHEVGDASVDSNQVFTRPGQGLISSAFSDANTHISLKVKCRAGVKEEHEIKEAFILGLRQNNKALHNSCKHLEFFSDDWQRGWEDRHGHSFLAIRCLLSSHWLCNFLVKILYYFCDRCHKGKIR